MNSVCEKPKGLEKAKGEWHLVPMSWNIKRMFSLLPQ